MSSVSPLARRGAVLVFVLAFGLAQTNTTRARKFFNDGLRAENAGEFEGALKAFSSAIEASPDNQPAWFHRARIRYTQGDFKDAAADLDKALPNK